MTLDEGVQRRLRGRAHDMFDTNDTSQLRKTALVADDDEGLRLLVRLALEDDGWVVEEAEDGASAVLMAETLRPDVMLLDVEMPRLDGFETCAKLRTLPASAHTPILMITGMDDQASISRAYEVGATDFLAKPFNVTVVCQRIQYMFRASQASRALQTERDFVSMIVGTSAALVVVLDADGRVLRFNPSCERASGYSASEAQGRLIWDILADPSGDDRERLMFERLIAERATVDYQGSWRTRDGAVLEIAWSNSVFVDHDGTVGNVVYTGLDVTERNQAEERLRFLASYDPLTGLPNRLLMTSRLQEAIAAADADGSRLAVVFLDLDRFNHIKSTLGHAGGDGLLKDVAARLAKSVRLSDVLARQVSGPHMELARLAGDEFAVLLPGIPDANAVASIIERLQDALARPVKFGDREYLITASVGAALYPGDADDAETLLLNSESAMNVARKEGRGEYHFYSESIQSAVSTRLSLESELRQAIDRGELVLHYQPKVSCATGTISGAEALLRWQHPSLGLVGPGTFIDLAEETGLIVPLGNWVLRAACTQVTDWLAAGVRAVPVAVNLSPNEFHFKDLLMRVASILNDSGVDTDYLAIEITESTVMRHPQEAREILGRFSELGVKVALDDFGTGHSALGSLKHLPFNSLKIDRTFIKDLAPHSPDLAITQAIITMAHGLGLTVVAEGVESQTQLDLLRAQACDEIQGFLISRPVPAEDFTAMLRDSEGREAEHWEVESAVSTVGGRAATHRTHTARGRCPRQTRDSPACPGEPRPWRPA